jgi:hypothetical protein
MKVSKKTVKMTAPIMKSTAMKCEGWTYFIETWASSWYGRKGFGVEWA